MRSAACPSPNTPTDLPEEAEKKPITSDHAPPVAVPVVCRCAKTWLTASG
jgi:hypothetical protein